MNYFLLFIVTALFATTVNASKNTHYDAKHCEVFVDKVIGWGVDPVRPYGITFYLKTLNERLDGKIKEVGLRSRCIGVCQNHDWTNKISSPFIDSNDYWKLSVPLGFKNLHSSQQKYEGAFFVLTEKGTYYWLKLRLAKGDSSFLIDLRLYDSIGAYYPVQYDPVATQSSEQLGFLNPDNCY